MGGQPSSGTDAAGRRDADRRRDADAWRVVRDAVERTVERPDADRSPAVHACPDSDDGRPASGDDDRERARLLPRSGRGGERQIRPFREFVPTGLPSPSVPSGNAVAALRLAMGPAPAGSPYHSAWTGVTAESVTAGDASITVRLSSGTRDATPLAAEQLVWTVQAALGSSLPVHFELADGSADVAPGHAASTSYTRPSDPIEVLGQVAPIWVDEPARGSVVKAGAPLTVSGVASTFEANVQWQLLRDGKVVDSGFTTASQGAPARGSYTFPTKQSLTAGAYVLRVFEASANDGSTVAEQRVPFTAR